jgi:hypothetical protein
MKTYRVSVPAVVNFSVAANSEQEAREIAAAIADGGAIRRALIGKRASRHIRFGSKSGLICGTTRARK